MEEHIIAWTGIGITVITISIGSTVFLLRQIDKRVPFAYYDRKHSELEDRIRKMEIWAAKKNGPSI